MGGKDSKPKEAAGGEPSAQAVHSVPKPASPKAAPAKPEPAPAPAAKAAPAGPIGDPSAMKLVVPANDPAALKCLIAASAGGIAVYQVAGEVRGYCNTTRYGEGVDEVSLRDARASIGSHRKAFPKAPPPSRYPSFLFRHQTSRERGAPRAPLSLLTHPLPPDPHDHRKPDLLRGDSEGRRRRRFRRAPLRCVRHGRFSTRLVPVRETNARNRRRRSPPGDNFFCFLREPSLTSHSRSSLPSTPTRA